MPPPPTAVAMLMVFLSSVLAAASRSTAQVPVPPVASPAPAASATPVQTQAIAAFRPHAERVCRALYVRPDAAAACVQRILNAALPLALDSTEPPTPGATPPAETRGTTVAPDGRE